MFFYLSSRTIDRVKEKAKSNTVDLSINCIGGLRESDNMKLGCITIQNIKTFEKKKVGKISFQTRGLC